MKIKIFNKWIGNKSSTIIVAEAGLNHNGSIKIAKKLIQKAKSCGADAVKFQTFKARDLTSTKSKFYKVFQKLEFDNNEFAELSDYSKSQGIFFFSTPFSFEAVDLLNNIKVSAFKIASGDLTNIPLIKYAAMKRKPIILSTGMGNIEEIKAALDTVYSVANKKIVLMHSISAYPPPINEVNLKAIQKMKEIFKVPIGFSDNGSDMLVPLISCSIGAEMIEKHFTLSHKMTGPDHKASANPLQFKEMVKKIRIIEKMFGDGEKHCQKSELDNRINARRSLTANINIEKGSILTKEIVGLKRPATGIEPKFFERVIGRRAIHSIEAEQSINWKDIK